jgi:hypothetical protein
MRTIVNLPREQIEALDRFGKSQGVSRAEVVRQAVAAFLPAKKKKSSFRNHPAFGSWKEPKGFNSVEHVRKLRAEWDHRG